MGHGRRKYKHQPTRLEMKRALHHIENLTRLVDRLTPLMTVGDVQVCRSADRFVAELTERMEMPNWEGRV